MNEGYIRRSILLIITHKFALTGEDTILLKKIVLLPQLGHPFNKPSARVLSQKFKATLLFSGQPFFSLFPHRLSVFPLSSQVFEGSDSLLNSVGRLLEGPSL